MDSLWKRSLCSAVVALGFVQQAAAQLALEFGAESFRWREFSNSARLLEESGPRYRLGASWSTPLGYGALSSVSVRGGLYFGAVDYDGQSQNLTTGATAPFVSETDYVGVFAEGIIANRVNPSSPFEVFAGGGLDSWNRDIAGHSGVSGAIEDWTLVYVLAGGGARWTNASARFHLSAGAKYPIAVYEAADFGLELEPKGRLSFVARFAIDAVRGDKPQWGVGIYYDSYRFAQSDPDVVFIPGEGFLTAVQPKSYQDVIGLYGSVYFY